MASRFDRSTWQAMNSSAGANSGLGHATASKSSRSRETNRETGTRSVGLDATHAQESESAGSRAFATSATSGAVVAVQQTQDAGVVVSQQDFALQQFESKLQLVQRQTGVCAPADDASKSIALMIETARFVRRNCIQALSSGNSRPRENRVKGASESRISRNSPKY